MTPTPPSVRVHKFTAQFDARGVGFVLLLLRDSYFLWVGDSASETGSVTARLGAVSLALASRLSGDPLATGLLGDAEGQYGHGLAQRLVRRTKAPWYVAWSLQAGEQDGASASGAERKVELEVLVERRLLEELKSLVIIANS